MTLRGEWALGEIHIDLLQETPEAVRSFGSEAHLRLRRMMSRLLLRMTKRSEGQFADPERYLHYGFDVHGCSVL